MKRKALGVLLTSPIAAQAAHAADIYNKDGNKLGLDGSVEGMRYISMMIRKIATRAICVSALKVKPKLMTN